MKRKLAYTITAFCFLLNPLESRAQSTDVPKYEIAADFSSLTKPDSDGGRTEPGLGGRFTYNLRKSVAIEAAGYFFPHNCQTCTSSNQGTIAEGLFGVKAGKRFQKWGIFGKARPGVISFSRGAFDIVPSGAGGAFPFTFQGNRLTSFAMDFGGVIEFYPSKRIVTRFDGGDTIIRYGQRQTHFVSQDPTTGAFTLVPFTLPADTRHNFQFIAGVGFRF